MIAKLANEWITIEASNNGEITSIIFNGQEVLHDGKQWWPKTYPMIWPTISYSNGFIVHGKNYPLPKHGFWKTLQWETILENDTITQMATHVGNDFFPFTIDIQNRIRLQENKVIIATSFANLSKDTAFFHFGHHPAFVIDEDSTLAIDAMAFYVTAKGQLVTQSTPFGNLLAMPFGTAYDTLVFKNPPHQHVTLQTRQYRLEMLFNDFPNLQVWRPQDARFICLEPWIGTNDNEYDAPQEAARKKGIITLASGATITKSITLRFAKPLSKT